MRRFLLVPALALVLAACGEGEDAGGGSPTPPSPSTQADVPCPDAALASGRAGAKPRIEIPDAAAPTKLCVRDLATGTGAEATAGATLTVHYVGVAWSNKREFDASWDGDPATFPLANVIPGWQEGIPGMKVGGRRELIIPPTLGYGAAGAGGSIGPNETLLFVIDLLGLD